MRRRRFGGQIPSGEIEVEGPTARPERRAPWEVPANAEDPTRRSDSHQAVLPAAASLPPRPPLRLSNVEVATDGLSEPPVEAPRVDAPVARPPPRPPALEDDLPLSGPGDVFDPATGWDFDALSDEGIDAAGPELGLRSPLAPEPPPPAPAPPEPELPKGSGRVASSWTPPGWLTPEELDRAVHGARCWLDEGRPGEAVALLESVDPTARFHPRLARWIARGERELCKRHCPDARPDRVAILTAGRAVLSDSCDADQWRLVNLIDGRSSVEALRVNTHEMGAVRFYRALGKLRRRFALMWSDESMPPTVF